MFEDKLVFKDKLVFEDKLMLRDKFINAILHGGQARVLSISAKSLVEEARRVHTLSRVTTAALGRQLMASVMIASGIKKATGSVTTLVKGDGPAGSLCCVAKPDLTVKGYVSNPSVELPPTKSNKLDVSGAVGKSGKLTVVRDLDMKEPYVGSVELVSGEIAEDFAEYFLASEQQPSIVYLGVRVQPASMEVISAAGIIIQAMPGCDEVIIETLMGMSNDISSLAVRVENEPLEHVLNSIFTGMDFEIVGDGIPRFECDCSYERTERALIALGSEELVDMIGKDNGAELTCHFCNKSYGFSADALQGLIDNARG